MHIPRTAFTFLPLIRRWVGDNKSIVNNSALRIMRFSPRRVFREVGEVLVTVEIRARFQVIPAHEGMVLRGGQHTLTCAPVSTQGVLFLEKLGSSRTP